MKFLFLISAVIILLAGCAEERKDFTLDTPDVTPETVVNEVASFSETTVPVETAVLETEPEQFYELINPKNTDFVCVADYIPDILTDLRYSTTNNFTGHVIYDFNDAYLRYGTVMKLKTVSEELMQYGLRLKIWDGFRPVSAQFKLWDIYPDSTYVANPNNGYSNHSRGFAVDVTLVDEAGNELQMPTAFDDFSAKADRDYSDCDKLAADHARLLESVMERHGFQGYWGEWWHFNDTEKYDVERYFDPSVISVRYLEKSAELLEYYWDDASVILTVSEGESVILLGFYEEYSLVEYQGVRGYLPSKSLRE